MANGKGGTAFLAILAIAALGLSGYLFVDNFFLSDDTHTHEPDGLNLVALWEDLDQNKVNNPAFSTDTNFLVEFTNNITINTEYVQVVNSTRFILTKIGLYKINLNLLVSNVDVSSIYWIIFRQNGTTCGYIDRFGTGTVLDSPFYQVTSSLYVNNTGINTYYEINGQSSGDPFFTSSTDQKFNQLSIEYLF